MARRRPAAPSQPLTFGSWVSHYLPAWTAIFLVVMPILFGNVVRSPGMSNVNEAKWAADVCLGMLSFWMWALVTNAHDGRLVRSSGRRAARDARSRREELALILFFLALTLASYVFCNLPIRPWVAIAVATISVAAPAVVLRSPEP
ncbi:MAG TPA: hypothetical protein VH575_11415 [Gemmataceae bacterium]|jgi:hypothetical protein